MSTAKNLMNKIIAVIMIVYTALLLLLFGAYAFAPESTQSFLDNMPGWMGFIIELFQADDAAAALLGSVFEELNINSDTPAFMEIELSFLNGTSVMIFVLIVGPVLVLFCSGLLKLIALIAVLIANLVGGIVAMRIMAGYSLAVAEGQGTWEIANTCFLTVLILFAILLFGGCEMWIDTFMESNEEKSVFGLIKRGIKKIWVSILVFLASAAVSLVLSGISWVFMGLGWSGFVLVSLFLICLSSIIMEGVVLFRVDAE